MAVTMNVFAKSIDGLYQDPFAQPKQQQKSFEDLLAEVLALKPLTPENGDLLSRAYSIRQELIDTLAGARSAQLGQLEEKYEAAVLTVREATNAVTQAEIATFKAKQVYVRLNSDYENLVRKNQALVQELSEQTFLTRHEGKQWDAKLETSGQKVSAAYRLADEQMNVVNQLAEEETKAINATRQAISVAQKLKGQIERLTK